MRPSSISRLVVTCGGYQASGQLIASVLPVAADGARSCVGFGERGGERLLDEDVHAVRRDLLDPFAVLGGGGAQHDDIGPGLAPGRRGNR